MLKEKTPSTTNNGKRHTDRTGRPVVSCPRDEVRAAVLGAPAYQSGHTAKAAKRTTDEKTASARAREAGEGLGAQTGCGQHRGERPPWGAS